MCDTYDAKCAGCDRAIPTHLGDFSVARSNVSAFCPGCHNKLLEYTRKSTHRPVIIFADTLALENATPELPAGVYLFAVDYPRHVGLNW